MGADRLADRVGRFRDSAFSAFRRISGERKRTRRGQVSASQALRVEGLEPRLLLSANFQISEFMASNNAGISDEDGNESDWLEIANFGDTAGSLLDWYVTDDAADLTQWQFPDISLDPAERLLVWASGKDRRDPQSELHTNFKLKAAGEYLALVAPDGQSIATEFAPEYPGQYTDVSYGITETITQVGLVGSSTPLELLVPTDNALGTTWTEAAFVSDASWTAGPGMGVGYDSQPDYGPLIQTDVGAAMSGLNASVFVRASFDKTGATGDALTMQVKYDDGFVAYLNGQEIARRNAPGSLAWNSAAVTDHPDSQAVVFETIDVSAYIGLIEDGPNVLAFHGLNVSSGSSDYLLDARLSFSFWSTGAYRFFGAPSPGMSNDGASEDTAPFISDVSHGSMAMPADNQDIWVTATVTEQGSSTREVNLHYRVMFGSEEIVRMYDDGLHQDGAAGDDVFGGSIPNSAATVGEMVRYYVTAINTSGDPSRFPMEAGPSASRYLGTVIANPGVSSQLPVYHWFVADPNWFRNGDGTNNRNEASTCLFYDGLFYDNVIVRTKGQFSADLAAPKFKFEFPSDNPFLFSPEYGAVGSFDLGSGMQDTSYSRTPLGFEVFREAGSYASLSFAVHTRLNGGFYRLSTFIERINSPFLRRLGVGDEGAVYKADGTHDANGNLLPAADIGTTSGMEKKNREDIDPHFDDLRALIAGVSPGNPARAQYMLDNVNIPEVISTIACYAIMKQYDCATHNYYVYRDSDGNGLWSLIPYDLDLVWDRLNEPVYGRYFSGHPYAGSSSYPTWTSAHWNRLIDAIVDTPITREMYLRRLRTLMDQILQPPGTPAGELRLEQRTDEMVATLMPEATADLAIWGNLQSASWGYFSTVGSAVAHLKQGFAARRNYLYGLSIIPQAQPENPPIYIGAIDYYPASGNQDEEYIEIVNPNNYAVDISGWSLANAVEHEFAGGTVIPANSVLYAVRDQNAFRARQDGPSGGQSLLIQGDYSGGLSSAGETLELFNQRSELVSTLTFEGNGPEVTDLGPIDFLLLDHLSLANDSLYYRFETSHDGVLTLQADPPNSGQIAQLKLYDADPLETAGLVPLAQSSLDADGNQRIDWTVTAGQTYYVEVFADNADFDIRVANLLSHIGTDVTVLGTPDVDRFEFDALQPRRVAINGVKYEFGVAEVATVSFTGNGDYDTADLTSADPTGEDNAELWPDHGTFNSGGVFTTLTDVDSINIDGGGGQDTVIIYGSTWGDKVTARAPTGAVPVSSITVTDYDRYDPNYVPTYSHSVANFEILTAHSNGGVDDASFFDSDSNDTFIAKQFEAQMSGAGIGMLFDFRAENFDYTHGYAKAGGSDTAELWDTPLSDHFKATPELSRMFRSDSQRRCKFFEKVVAIATGGNDDAKLWDSDGADRLEASPTESRLYGTGYDVTVRSFGDVTVRAATGFDRAFFTGGDGDDLVTHKWIRRDLMVKSPKSEMMDLATGGDVYKITARKFDRVSANAGIGANDVARFWNTLDDDQFLADGDTASMSNLDNELLYDAIAFDKVTFNHVNGGNDTTVENAHNFLLTEI